MFAAARIPDRTEILDDVDRPEACVLSDLAEIFLLGTRESPDDSGGGLLVKTLRPFRLPGVVCSERVSTGMLVLDTGLSLSTVMNP